MSVCGLPESTKRSLLLKIEERGGIVAFIELTGEKVLDCLLATFSDEFGSPKSALKRSVQNRVARWKKLTLAAYIAVCKSSGVVPHPQTVQREYEVETGLEEFAPVKHFPKPTDKTVIDLRANSKSPNRTVRVSEDKERRRATRRRQSKPTPEPTDWDDGQEEPKETQDSEDEPEFEYPESEEELVTPVPPTLPIKKATMSTTSAAFRPSKKAAMPPDFDKDRCCE